MDTLFPINIDKDLIPIEKSFAIKKVGDDKISLYLRDKLLKVANIKPQIEFRMFAIDLVNSYSLKKSRVAPALHISRQSLDNWLDIYHQTGLAGLENNPRGINGNKARILEEQRKEAREIDAQMQHTFNFYDGEKKIEKSQSPYEEEYTWQKTRYAGVFVHLITLMFKWKWFNLIIGYFGDKYKVFQVFLLMVVRNIPSIEQIKHIRNDEAKLILGLNIFPGKYKLWEWFYQVISYRLSTHLLKDYFRFQIMNGIVNLWLWFTDGHRLGYTGKQKLHQTYNTQRQMPEPGRTNMVSCDLRGNIADFEIEEGKGDMKTFILNTDEKWAKEIKDKTVKVFDREGDGKKFFSEMVRKKIPFVTWEKHSDTKKLNDFPAEKFSSTLKVGGKEYAFFEDTKDYTYKPEEETEDNPEHNFTLRRIYLWNKSTGKRTSGLAYDPYNKLTLEDCVFAILNRWGASENTFKHIQSRHPYNYQPGFQFTESENQSIANPQIKKKQKQIKSSEKQISKLYKESVKSKESLNKNGEPRVNSKKVRIVDTIRETELTLENLKQEVKSLPERVDISTINPKKSFKVIDNEGKRLFDFVNTVVWNSRNQLIDWLQSYYTNKNEIVDLLYAITNCQGWIKTTKNTVTVRIEPLQQAGKRKAQEQLCKKLTGLCVQTPTGKFLVIEVGNSPI